MRHLARLWIIPAVVATLANTCTAQNQTRDGALMGGVAGALIGGVVGKQKRLTARQQRHVFPEILHRDGSLGG